MEQKHILILYLKRLGNINYLPFLSPQQLSNRVKKLSDDYEKKNYSIYLYHHLPANKFLCRCKVRKKKLPRTVHSLVGSASFLYVFFSPSNSFFACLSVSLSTYLIILITNKKKLGEQCPPPRPPPKKTSFMPE